MWLYLGAVLCVTAWTRPSSFLTTPRVAPPACHCQPTTLCHPVQTVHEKEIFAFHVPRHPNGWQHFNWSEVTTIAVFGAIDPHMVCEAHKHNVRVVTGEGFNKADLNNNTARVAWVQQRVAEAKVAGLDGLNFDIEGDRTDKDGLTALVTTAFHAFHSAIPGSQVTFDLTIEPSANNPGYDFPALEKVLDFLVPMGYDMCWGTKVAKPNAPIKGLTSGLTSYGNLGIPMNRIVLGLPWYGWDFPCTNSPKPGEPCSVKQPFGGGKWQVCYSDAIAKRNGTLHYTTSMDAAFYTYHAADGPHQVWYDDAKTLTTKYQMSRQKGLKGVAFWYAECVPDSDHTMWPALSAFLN